MRRVPPRPGTRRRTCDRHPTSRADLTRQPHLNVLVQLRIGDQLRDLWTTSGKVSLPLRGRRPIVELPASCGGVPSQLTRDRPRTAPTSRPISRTPLHWALRSAISSCSRNDRYLSEGGLGSNGRIPPYCRNHRVATAGATPTTRAASSARTPFAISSQNAVSMEQCLGCPSDLNFGRTARSAAC